MYNRCICWISLVALGLYWCMQRQTDLMACHFVTVNPHQPSMIYYNKQFFSICFNNSYCSSKLFPDCPERVLYIRCSNGIWPFLISLGLLEENIPTEPHHPAITRRMWMSSKDSGICHCLGSNIHLNPDWLSLINTIH